MIRNVSREFIKKVRDKYYYHNFVVKYEVAHNLLISVIKVLLKVFLLCIFSEPIPYLAAKRRKMNSCYTLEVMSITTTEVGYGLLI